jgi:Mrp family chromosome partitioning ATPase
MANISKEAYELLQRLIEKAKNNNDNYVGIDIPMQMRKQRVELADELEQKGYIERVDFYGQNKLRCKVTAEGMNI